MLKYLLVFIFSLSARTELITNCSSILISNIHNVEYVAYIKDNSTTNIYSDWLFVKNGTNYVIPTYNGNKHLIYTNPPCNPQIWSESDGNITKITYVNCSKLAVFNPDNLNHHILISRDLIKWSNVLITYNIVKVPTDENMAFFRIK